MKIENAIELGKRRVTCLQYLTYRKTEAKKIRNKILSYLREAVQEEKTENLIKFCKPYLSNQDWLKELDMEDDVKPFWFEELKPDDLEVGSFKWRKNGFDTLAATQPGKYKASLAYRISEEAKRAAKYGWYMVFDTCTFEIYPTDEELKQTWESYRKRVAYAVGRASYPELKDKEIKRIKIKEYCRHACVLELGKEKKRPHFHVIWYFRNIPNDWKIDPNYGKICPENVEIKHMKGLWEEGISTPEAIRLGKNDIWAKKHQWQWPTDKGNSLGKEKTGAVGVGLYLGKYLGKQGDLKWRIRLSRGLGKEKIEKMIRDIPTRMLRPLSTLHRETIWLNENTRLPSSILRNAAKSERWRRLLGSRKRRIAIRIMNSMQSFNLGSMLKNCAILIKEKGCDYARQAMMADIEKFTGSEKRWKEAKKWVQIKLAQERIIGLELNAGLHT